MPTIAESPLASCHRALGARMITFAGWNLPVEYRGLLAEHQSTRHAAGLFDISHMGQIRACGKGALAALETLLANDPAKLRDGEGQYTFLLNEQGGVIDDLYLYRLSPEEFLLVVNASRHAEDLRILLASNKKEVSFAGNPGSTAGMALQGPKSSQILARILPPHATLPSRNQIAPFQLAGHGAWVGATGYTGEDGFEIFTDLATGPLLWNAIMEAGKSDGLLPCGLGSRDSLRLEAGFPLNGQDLSPEITPIEAGLGFFVDLKRPRPFPGRSVLESQKKNGTTRICVGLEGQPGQPPPRHDYPVFQGDKRVGVVTSGVPSPTLGYGIALALITTPAPVCGQNLEFEVRGRRVPVKVSSRRFIPRK